MTPPRSTLAIAPRREKRGHFQFAAVFESPRRAAVPSEQPVGRAGIDVVQCVGLQHVFVGHGAKTHHIRVTGNTKRNAAAIDRVALGRRQGDEHGVAETLRFGPDGIHVRIDRDIANKIAQLAVMGVQLDCAVARVIGRNWFGGRVRALWQQTQLLQQLFHALGLGAQRCDGLSDRSITVLKHVGRRANRGNSIAQGMAYAA